VNQQLLGVLRGAGFTRPYRGSMQVDEFRGQKKSEADLASLRRTF
jgi:hypothetical protein